MLGKRSLAFFLAITIGFFATGKAVAITLAETPSPVQKVITARIGDGSLDEIDQTNEAGEMTFDVSFTDKAGNDQGFTVADDGTLLSIEVDLAATPAAVQKTIQAVAPGWDLEDVSKNVGDTEISYEADVSQGDREKNFTVGADGALLDMEVTLGETPAAVQSAIAKHLDGGPLQSIDENFDPDGDSFDIEGQSKTGESKAFCISTNGTLLSVEVSLAKISPGARKTILAKIGDGKILSIDKSTHEKQEGVMPYEVEGRKDGKPFHFRVGPHGKFLGMDEE